MREALNLAELHDKGQWDLGTDEGQAEFGHALWDSFLNGVTTMGAIHAATGMVGFSADMDRVQEAKRSQEFFSGLSDNAAASKVRERNPNAYQDYIAAQAQGSPAENIYIDGRQMATVFNQTGLDPA
ncbi:MAG: hypothetical protein FWD64_12490, partial [Acidobacteriaceae bacterium]|nr:hypothetical protein [Acidobacteriaceae bacterium]